MRSLDLVGLRFCPRLDCGVVVTYGRFGSGFIDFVFVFDFVS